MTRRRMLVDGIEFVLACAILVLIVLFAGLDGVR